MRRTSLILIPGCVPLLLLLRVLDWCLLLLLLKNLFQKLLVLRRLLGDGTSKNTAFTPRGKGKTAASRGLRR